MKRRPALAQLAQTTSLTTRSKRKSRSMRCANTPERAWHASCWRRPCTSFESTILEAVCSRFVL